MPAYTTAARNLAPGDRIVLGDRRATVRTVSYVTDTGMVNRRDTPILAVYYAEGATDGWGPGNTWAADSPVTVCGLSLPVALADL